MKEIFVGAGLGMAVAFVIAAVLAVVGVWHAVGPVPSFLCGLALGTLCGQVGIALAVWKS